MVSWPNSEEHRRRARAINQSCREVVVMRQWIAILCLILSAIAIGCWNDSNGVTPTPDGGAKGDGGGTLADGGGGDAGLAHIDRSHLTDAGTSGSLDYSDPSLWVCRPGIDENPCYGNLDATELLPDGGRQVVPHMRADSPKFDCFYVYPTVELTHNGNMTNFSDIKNILDPLLAQAARFNQICEVYAPLYRQVAFVPGGGSSSADAGAAEAGADAGAEAGAEGGASGADASSGDAGGSVLGGPANALAQQDVRDAFSYYMAHFNNGRKFVIMGHSQGTLMLMSMMQKDVDPMPKVRSQMISALLIGGGTTVAPGQTTNGTFKNIPTCAQPGDTGCVIAYSSYEDTTPPGANGVTPLFGRSPDGNQVVCTDPAPLAGNSPPYKGSYFPVKVNNALLGPDTPAPQDAGTPFVLYRGIFQGTCVNKNGYNYLEIKRLEQAGDPRGVPPYTNAGSISLGFGLHIADYNLPLEDLIEAVTKQAAKAVP
jgi:hypothetical protein